MDGWCVCVCVFCDGRLIRSVDYCLVCKCYCAKLWPRPTTNAAHWYKLPLELPRRHTSVEPHSSYNSRSILRVWQVACGRWYTSCVRRDSALWTSSGCTSTGCISSGWIIHIPLERTSYRQVGSFYCLAGCIDQLLCLTMTCIKLLQGSICRCQSGHRSINHRNISLKVIFFGFKWMSVSGSYCSECGFN